MPFDGPDGYRAGIEDLARILRPPHRVTVTEWAAAHRILTSKTSAFPGEWKNERVPYLSGFMNALDARHPAPLVIVAKSAQSCFSDAVLNWIGRSMHQSPSSFLALWPSVEVGKKWVRTRVRPMIAGIPGLSLKMSSGKKQTDSTLLELHWPGGILNVGSANKVDDVATVSVANLIFDEVDRMPVTLPDEGDPIELAFQRSANFPRKKAVMVSTPTSAETSRIWPAWLSSTMDRFYVPCVHCGHMQHLRWQQLQWTAKKPSGAGYVCEECAAFMENRHKTEMLAAGEWRSTHPEREEEVKGFHINGLYAPVGLGHEWAAHAAAWERAQGSLARIQVFYNTRLGEVHKGERVKVEWEEVRNRHEPYKLREIPKGVLILTDGTDVQSNRLETHILGHGRGEQITVIDYRVLYGDTTRPEVWSALDEYLAGEFVNAFGVRMRLSCTMIDSAYLQDVVLGFTRPRKARGIYASRGSTNATRQPIGKPSWPDVKHRGKTDNRSFGVERYEIGVSVLKHWLYELLRADAGTEDAPVQIADRHIRFSTDLPDEYFRQLTAETFDPKHGWIERANYHRNEALDTFLLGRAAAMHHSVNIHRMREADWQRLEQLYEPAEGKKPAVIEATLSGGRFMPTSATTTPTDLP